MNFWKWLLVIYIYNASGQRDVTIGMGDVTLGQWGQVGQDEVWSGVSKGG